MHNAKIRAISSLLFIALLTLVSSTFAQQRSSGWDPISTEWNFNGMVEDFAVFDDGTGPALYAAGYFSEINHEPAKGIAKWDGHDWTEVGGGLVAPRGPGSAFALQVWDDGRGPALYVGGAFILAGDAPAGFLARWDGKKWSSVGGGFDYWVTVLGTFDDGRGEALYAGGWFRRVGNQPLSHIGRWDGRNWESLAQGIPHRQPGGFFRPGDRWREIGEAAPGYVQSMAVFDDGDGPALYVGGSFHMIGDLDQCRYLGRWNGKEWSRLSGVDLKKGASHFMPKVENLVVFDDGSGPALFLSGNVAQDVERTGLLKWNGKQLSAVPGYHAFLEGYTYAIAVHDDGSGPALWFNTGVDAVKNREKFQSFGRWDGKQVWRADSFPGDFVHTMISFDDGSGPAIYLGGTFTQLLPSGTPVHHIVRWKSPDGVPYRGENKPSK